MQAQWQNLTRARFATEQTFTQYSPISYVDKVQAPLMIIAGEWCAVLRFAVGGGGTEHVGSSNGRRCDTIVEQPSAAYCLLFTLLQGSQQLQLPSSTTSSTSD